MNTQDTHNHAELSTPLDDLIEMEQRHARERDLLEMRSLDDLNEMERSHRMERQALGVLDDN